MDDDAIRRMSEQMQDQALRGSLPRHVMNVRLGPDALDDRYEKSCRKLLEDARSASDEICGALEERCHELKSLVDAGLSDRIRYLTAIACVATAADLRLRADARLDRLPYLRTAHQVVDEWREGATHDLSNLLGPLEFLPMVDRLRDDIVGFWIWLNLGDGNQHRHLTWVKSSMRFARGYGQEIFRRFGPESGRTEPGTPTVTGESPGLSREQASQIAEGFLEENHLPLATGQVRQVLAWDEIDFRRPNVYGYSEPFWRSHWIVYLEQEGMALRESLIMAIHRDTGEVGYVGGAGDEG